MLKMTQKLFNMAAAWKFKGYEGKGKLGLESKQVLGTWFYKLS